MNPNYNYLWKLAVIGDSAVGKSCFVLRFADETYTDSYISTIGVEFKIVTLRYLGVVIKLQIWDTPGDGRLSEAVKKYNKQQEYQHGKLYNGALILYDITDKITFENLKSTLNEYIETYGEHLVLVGNKSDIDYKRKVSFQEGEKFAREHGMSFIEVSAKTGENVDNAFKLISNVLYSTLDSNRKIIDFENRIVIKPLFKFNHCN